ncbi:MAG: hypothetical protein WBG46_10325 [Nonlabens sp.]
MKKWIIITVSIIFSVIAIYVALTLYANQRIQSYIENEVLKVEISVEEVSSNLLSGNVSVSGITIESKENSQMDEFKLQCFSYWDYLFNNKITVDKIELSKFYVQLPLASASSKSSGNSSKTVEIGKIVLNDGGLSLKNNDTLKMKLKNLNSDISKISFNTNDFKKNLNYELKKINCDSLFYRMNASQNLYIPSLSLSNDIITLDSLQMNTNDAMQKRIENDEINKDVLTLRTTLVEISNYDFNLFSESYFKANKIKVDGTFLKVDANNNLKKSESRTTYSEQLRKMTFSLKIDTVSINNASVSYSEPNVAYTDRGAITFENINAKISNFTNEEGKGAIKMHTTSTFMQSSKLTTNFSMNPYAAHDEFNWEGDLERFQLQELNSFMDPVLDIKLEGVVDQYYFNINGSESQYKADIRLKYDNVNINLYNENKNKKVLLSGLLNLLGDNSTNGEFVTESASMDRDPKETFFNQLWLIQRKALMKVVK